MLLLSSVIFCFNLSSHRIGLLIPHAPTACVIVLARDLPKKVSKKNPNIHTPITAIIKTHHAAYHIPFATVSPARIGLHSPTHPQCPRCCSAHVYGRNWGYQFGRQRQQYWAHPGLDRLCWEANRWSPEKAWRRRYCTRVRCPSFGLQKSQGEFRDCAMSFNLSRMDAEKSPIFWCFIMTPIRTYEHHRSVRKEHCCLAC